MQQLLTIAKLRRPAQEDRSGKASGSSMTVHSRVSVRPCPRSRWCSVVPLPASSAFEGLVHGVEQLLLVASNHDHVVAPALDDGRDDPLVATQGIQGDDGAV